MPRRERVRAARAERDRRADQRAGLVDVHVFELRHGQGLAHAREIDRLPARHAAAAARGGEDLHHFDLNRGIIGETVLGEQLKCERLQTVAHEKRGRLVEFDVASRLAAAKHVVVHAGQVVVHERIGVNVFYGAGRDFEPRRVGADRFACGGLACGKREQGPYALASAEHRIAHRVMQALRRYSRGREKTLQRRFDPSLDSCHPGGEFIRRRRHRGSFSACFLQAP